MHQSFTMCTFHRDVQQEKNPQQPSIIFPLYEIKSEHKSSYKRESIVATQYSSPKGHAENKPLLLIIIIILLHI